MPQEDYPKNFEEFLTWFESEHDCVQYVKQLRWPDGFHCPRCQSSKSWETSRNLIHCSQCGHQSSVTAGTLFQDSRKPLRLWFHVMWFLMSQKTGVSAKNLRDVMGFGSYKTVWAWLHKIRRVMIRPGRDRLKGIIEIDEAYIGGKEKGIKGRAAESKVLVAVAVEVEKDKKKLGRVRFHCIPNASADSLISFVQENVEMGSEIITDGWKAYHNLQALGYPHTKQIIRGSEQDASSLLPHVHLVVTLVKRWLRGTHQGAVTAHHLNYYLDEFAFRFNRRLSTHRGKLFYRLMQQAVATEATPTKELYHKKKNPEPQHIVAT